MYAGFDANDTETTGKLARYSKKYLRACTLVCACQSSLIEHDKLSLCMSGEANIIISVVELYLHLPSL